MALFLEVSKRSGFSDPKSLMGMLFSELLSIKHILITQGGK